MKTLLLGFWLAVAATATAAAVAADHGDRADAQTHRYLVQRTFPKGALDGLDAATKAKVNANNHRFGVTWVMSFATADKQKTYCVYLGPSEAAVRLAAKANLLPVDSIVEVPVTLASN